jgi:hypothetical protein
MAIGPTNVHEDTDSLTECERALRATAHVTTRWVGRSVGRFEVVNPVPLTLDRESFRERVERVAARYDLRVEGTDSPFRLVVSRR